MPRAAPIRPSGKLRYRALTRRDWPIVEQLFGERGACGGCWCMWWRVERGGKTWHDMKGDKARRSLKRLIESGRARAILAFDGDEPIGWCAFGPRSDFPRVETVKAYRPPDDAEVWSIPCFFILAGHRGRGVARGLLAAAVAAARKAGATCIEGYPVTNATDGKPLPAAFSWTGPKGIFDAQGFTVASRANPRRPLVRLTVSARSTR